MEEDRCIKIQDINNLKNFLTIYSSTKIKFSIERTKEEKNAGSKRRGVIKWIPVKKVIVSNIEVIISL